MTHSFDTIIIGSGVSGMAAGIILAKEGEKVLVLEQNAVPGGLTQTFKRGGLIFPTGVHRLGALNPGQALWYYFNYLGLMDSLQLLPMSQEGFESYYFPGQCFKVPSGHDAYKAKLIHDFPKQKNALDRYFKDMTDLVKGMELYNPGCTGSQDRSMEFTGSLDHYFSVLGIHGPLKSILTANNPLFGLSSQECPVMTHFIISDSYLNSSFKINESATPFSRTLVNKLEALNGEVRIKSRVKTILIEDRKARGVALFSGETLKADRIIFSGHPALLPDLCPPKSFRPVYPKRLKSAKNTSGMFGLGLKWKKNDCPVINNDAYIYDSWNVNAHYEQCGPKTDSGMILLTALPQAAPGDEHIAVTGLAQISPQEIQRLGTGYKTAGKKKYNETKKELAQKIMKRINRTFPGAGDSAQLVDTYSPFTFERYTLAPGGTAYGVKKTAQAFLQGTFNPATRVKGLFLTGQSIGLCGVHGAIYASINLCRQFYPDRYLIDKIRNHGKENQ